MLVGRARLIASRLLTSVRADQVSGGAASSQHSRAFATAAEGVQDNSSKLLRFGLPALFAGTAGYGAYSGYNYVTSPASTKDLPALQADEHPHDIGTFTLIEASGKPFTEKHVKKEFAVLLFGALDHEDRVMWLDKFARAVHESDEKCNQEHLKPIFLCLDAEKDTPERCKQVKDGLKSHHLYKETFHRRVAVVTGEDVAKVHEAAHTFTRKFFGKHPRNTGTPCSTDLGDIYMISPDGKFLEAYGLGESTPEEISDDWARVQRAWNIHHPSWHGCRNVAKRYA